MTGPSSPRDRPDLRHVQPDGSVLFRGPHVRVRIAVLSQGVVLASAHGEVVDAEDISTEAAVLAELDRELERAGTLTLLVDLRDSPRMPAASREKIAHWARHHQTRLGPSHVLVRSKLLEMALSIITMLLGGGVFEMHTNARAFLDVVKKADPSLTELPRVPA